MHSSALMLLILGCVVAGGLLSCGKKLGSSSSMYPAAPSMPALTTTPMSELLASYESFISKQAPNVLATLQPGLTDAEIDALEQQHSFKLTPDLRALYAWRNGTSGTSGLDAFPDLTFVALNDAVTERSALNQTSESASASERALVGNLIGHRKSWLNLLSDGAGDGYYYDPLRTEAEGSFFFNFGEAGYYAFYPGFRNYLAAVVEGSQQGLFVSGSLGIESKDPAATLIFYSRFSASQEL